MMPALFIAILLLVAFGLTLPGAMAGVRHFLMPDFDKLGMSGVLDALGLAFFSLSIGLGIHTTYGAYLVSSGGGPLQPPGWCCWRASSPCWRA